MSLVRVASWASWLHWFMHQHDLSSVLWFWTPWFISVALFCWQMLKRCSYLSTLKAEFHEYEAKFPQTVVRKGSAARRALPWSSRVSFPLPGVAVTLCRRCGPLERFSETFGETDLVLDIWRQPSDELASKQLRPVLVVVHGGAWLSGDKRYNDPGVASAYTYANEGWVSVCLTHRHIRNGWPKPALDVAAGLQWMYENIEQYGGDPEQVVLMGRSSGGHILAHIATLQAKSSGGDAESTIDKKSLKPDDLKFLEAVKKLRERPVGLVLYYPVLNLNDDNSGHFQRWCCACSCCGRGAMERGQNMLTWFWKLALAAYQKQPIPSPVDKISASLCPVMIVHGAMDDIVAIASARDFFDRLQKERQKPTTEGEKRPVVADEFLEVPDGSHSFDQILDDTVVSLIDHTLSWSEACLTAKRVTPTTPATPATPGQSKRTREGSTGLSETNKKICS